MTIRKTALLAPSRPLPFRPRPLPGFDIDRHVGRQPRQPVLPLEPRAPKPKQRNRRPYVEITAVSSDYDLNKQFTQIDNFIASGVDIVLLNAADPTAIEPAKCA